VRLRLLSTETDNVLILNKFHDGAVFIFSHNNTIAGNFFGIDVTDNAQAGDGAKAFGFHLSSSINHCFGWNLI